MYECSSLTLIACGNSPHSLERTMPHSITGKHRSKRPDSRPNAKKRKKDRDAAYAAAEAKDVISTRIPKREQKERPVTGELRQEFHSQLDEEAKRVRYLQKLLRQIETLKMKKERGEKLNDAQMKKLGRMDEVVAEIEELLDVNLGSSSEDEEDDDEEGEDEINKGSDQNEEAEKQVSKMKKR